MVGRRTVVLLAGDLLMLAAFVVLGRSAHGGDGERAAALAVAGTMAPFGLAWLVATVPILLRQPVALAATWPLVRQTILTWSVAYPIAVVLRALAIGRTSPLSFYVVSLLLPLALLVAWRLAFALGARRLRLATRVDAAEPETT